MTNDELIRFFQFSWILLAGTAILPLYLSRESLKSRSTSFRLIIMIVLYALIGIVVQENFDEFTSSEIKIILSILSIGIAGIVLPNILTQCEVRYEQDLKLKPRKAMELVTESFRQIKTRLNQKPGTAEYTSIVKSGYGNEYLLNVQMESQPTTKTTYTSIPYGNSLLRFRALFLLSAYAPIFSLANDAFEVTIPIFANSVDAEVLFFSLFSLLVLFVFLLHSVQRNFFYEFEEVQKDVLRDFAKKATETTTSRNLGVGKPDLKIDLDAARERAEKIKSGSIKSSLSERQKKVRERVEGVMGSKKEEEEGIDPELIRNQLLIRKIKTILKSTPVAMEVTLKDIAKKISHNDTKQIEQIVIGLIDRKEVVGSYDIWKGVYSVGDSSSQFIEKTLQKLDLTVEDLEYIKVNRRGDVEIRFDGDHKSEVVIENKEVEEEEELES
jgi:hypothetical protein